MSNPLKSLAKGIKRIGRALKSAVSSIGKAVKSVFKSPIGKAVLLGAGLFFGVPFAANALKLSSAAAAGSTGGAWWGSTFGIGQAATAGAGQATATSLSAATPLSTTVATTAPTAITSPALASAGTGGFSSAAGSLGSAAATTAPTTTASTGILGKLWTGLGDAGKAAVINMAGNALTGSAEAKAEQKKREEEWRREDEAKAAQSIYGVRHDGGRPVYDYHVGSLLAQAGTGFTNPYAGRFMVPARRDEEGLLSHPMIYQA